MLPVMKNVYQKFLRIWDSVGRTVHVLGVQETPSILKFGSENRNRLDTGIECVNKSQRMYDFN